MKKDFNDFDDILNGPGDSFQKGKEDGIKQASTYSMEDIEKEGNIYGSEVKSIS